MKCIADINLQEALGYIKIAYQKTTKKQRIIFAAVVLVLLSGFLFGKDLWQKYSIQRRAKKIVARISQSEQAFFNAEQKYKKDIFSDNRLVRELEITVGYNDVDPMEDPFLASRRRKRNKKSDQDLNVGQSGDFFIDVDAENGCLVVKHDRNSINQTTFYASFENNKVLCQGKRCFKQAKNGQENLCYVDGSCFAPRLKAETKRLCGDGKGHQTRECQPSCEGAGICGEWSSCQCERGFEWDGKTCKQTQTEKDCTKEQCFTGVYCEDREPLIKDIPNGSCKRFASCQKNRGWNYTSWECSCNDEKFCALKEECVTKPENQDDITLPNDEGFCTGIYYDCTNGQGWIQKAKNCTCYAVGTFWDAQKGETKCSPCTKKQEGTVFTSAGTDKDDCSWKCGIGYYDRGGNCRKPDGQYLCAHTDLQICTDDFSKKRKIQKDAPKTNEGQSCFVEDKDNILFYNQKERTCQICQCVDLIDKKILN